MAQIVFDHVTKIFEPEELVLEEISFRIEKGEFVFLIGKSGVGKSSILKLLSRQEEPSAGHIFVDEKDISLLKRRELPYFRRKFGIMQADMRCLRDRDVYENLFLVMRSCGFSRRESKRRIAEALGRVGMAHRVKAFPQELSVGEEARVLLARALVTGPEILLADEPTGNLDSGSTKEIMDILRGLHEEGRTVILITHDNEIAARAKRVIKIMDGRIEEDYENVSESEE